MAWKPFSPLYRKLSVASRMQGVTLIELSVTLAVLAILVAIGVPSYQSLMKRQRVDAAMHLLTSHLASARVTAISYRTPTVVCPTDGGGVCRGDSDWSRGWLMFRDPDGNHQPDEELDIFRNDPAPRQPGLRILSTSGRRQVRYLPSGYSSGSNMTLRVCIGDEVAGLVVVNNAGRIRSSRPQKTLPCNG